LQAKPDTKYLAELYLAEPELVLSLVRKTSDRIPSVMIVGHNPGLEQCALALAAVPLEKKLRKRYEVMDEKFPTCPLAAIHFEVEQWRDVTPGRGDLDACVRPKDLEE